MRSIMASKPKNRNFIVLRVGTYGQPRYTGRYRVGARNGKEAIRFLQEVFGKHAQFMVYYEIVELTIAHGTVIVDHTKEILR